MRKQLKVLRYIGLGFLFCFTAIWFLLINFVFSTSKIALQYLPPNLISNQSAAGKKLPAESIYADYSVLQENFVSQSRRAFCGVASSVIALNSLINSQYPVTQSSLFDSDTRKVIHPLKVTFRGMTLAQFNGILRANQLNTKLIYAADIDIDRFRMLARNNLKNPQDVILVNYKRPALNQPGGGHISPVAAYHQESDRFLILDVAAYKYPATWVKTEELWNGINSIDSVSDRSRGLIAVKN